MENNNNEIISLKELIQSAYSWVLFIISRWKLLFITSLIGASIGFAYAYTKKINYNAYLTFAIEDEKSSSTGLGGALGLVSSLGLDVSGGGGGIFMGSNLLELMKSRLLIEKTLLSTFEFNGKRTSIADAYLDIYKIRKDFKEDSYLSRLKFTNEKNTDPILKFKRDSIIGVLHGIIKKDHLNIQQKDKKVNIITITSKFRDPILAKNFAEILLENASDFYIKTKTKKAFINVNILQRQADSIRAELNMAINNVAIATDNTFNLNSALNIKRTPSQRKQIDVQANTAILTELVKNLELAKVSLRKETPLVQVIDSPILPLEKEKKSKLLSMILFGFIFFIITVLFISVKVFLQKLFSENESV